MPAVYEGHGLRFMYPENWQLDVQPGESVVTISVQSPSTAFWMITLFEGQAAAGDVAAEALSALRDDYPELDADEARETLAGHPAVGHDISFVSLDLTNTCWTRAFRAPPTTFLVIFQTNDRELPQSELVLRAISKSLTLQP